MWCELIWNIDFLRGLIFLTLGVSAAIFIIPYMLKHLQSERDKRLAKALLKKWGSGCISAIMRLKPLTFRRMLIEGYGKTADPDEYVSDDFIVTQFWKDIREGKRDPDGAAMIINNALDRVLFSDEERMSKEAPPDSKYPFLSGDPDVPRAWIRQALNGIYANLHMFDVELLPIDELEIAMSALDTFSESGYITRYAFLSFALHLAQSMEKFAKYLWKLEGWSK